MKTFHIITIGCQMNKSDSERFASKMEELGYQESRNKYEADFVIINTCGVRQAAEDRIYGLIPGIKKKNKKVKIIITGCLVYRKDVQKKLKNRVDFFIPIIEISNLDSIISNKRSKKRDYLKIKPKYNSNFSAFVPIGNGCNNFCAYCVVPYARGREVYRSVKEILNEVKYLVENGYKEITLIAQNVNSYSVKKAKEMVDFADLLKMVNDIPGDFWIRFSTSHPKDMSAKLIKTIASCKKVCRHIHLPAQAGDNEILKAMNRKYTIEHYKKLIKDIKKLMPEVALTTDIIVGFPGETKKQFNNTKKLFREVGYDMAYISQYSTRPGTVAEKLNDNILGCEKKRREEELTNVLRKTALANGKKYLGKTVSVLVEGKNKNNKWFGKTGTNKTVKFISSANNLTGSFVDVKIQKAEDFGLTGAESTGKKILVILGPTSSGKTKLAVKLAKKYNGEIVSADSRQVYKGMDIGTGKDLDEYGNVPYHLIDVASPKEQFSLAQYQKLAFKAIDDILSRGRLPILVGGSGLYLQAVVDNYLLSDIKPGKTVRNSLEKLSVRELLARLTEINKTFVNKLNDSDKKNKRRLIRYLEIFSSKGIDYKIKTGSKKYDSFIVGVNFSRDILNKRIYQRLLARFDEGMVNEVKTLRKNGVNWKRLEDFGLEYRFISQYLQEKLGYDEMVEKLNIAIRQFAKRQMTWFRRWEKQGTEIHWDKKYEKALKDFIKG